MLTYAPERKIVKSLLRVDGKHGLAHDKAGGALSNGSTGVKNILDADGIFRATLTNEIRFKNARRERNSLLYSNDFSNGAYTLGNGGTGVLPVKTVNYGIAPDGTQTACRLQLDRGAGLTGSDFSRLIYTTAVGVNHNFTVSLKLTSGLERKTVRLYAGSTLNHFVVTDQWQHFNVVSAASSNVQIALFGAEISTGRRCSQTADILIAIPGLQFVGGRSCFNPYPNIHGGVTYNAGVAGVKYFPTKTTPYSKILVVGDSFTVYPTLAAGWASLLELRTNTAIDNWGVAGTNLADEITTALSAHINDEVYDAVFIGGGTNDIADGISFSALQAAAINAFSIAAGSDIYTWTMPCRNGFAGWTTAMEAIAVQYNTWVISYCSENNINLIDLRAILGLPGDNTVIDPQYNQLSTPDFLHPGYEGAMALCNAALQAIRDKFGFSGFDMYGDVLATLPTLLHEPATDNLALFPRDLTNAAWVKTNCTPAKTSTGIDGVASSCSRLTATAANATCLQTITSASANRITGAFIKRITGTGAIEMTQDNGSTWTPVTITTGWPEEAIPIPAATVANPVIGFRIVTSGDAIDVDYVQSELGSYITSPISGSRDDDALSIPLLVGTNLNPDKGICLAKLKMNFANSATAKPLISTNTGATDFIHDTGSGAIAISDGTNTAVADVGGWAVGDILTITAEWDSVTSKMGIQVKKNSDPWVDSSDATYDGAFPAGSNFLFCNGNTDAIDIYYAQILDTNMNQTDAKNWIKTNAAEILTQ